MKSLLHYSGLRALEIYEKVLGANHPTTVEPVYNLGDIYKITGKLGRAEELLLRALDVWLTSLGPKHPWTIEAVNNIIDLYERMNLPEKAAHYKAMLVNHTKTDV